MCRRILVPSYLMHIFKANLLHSEQILLQLQPRIAFIHPSRFGKRGKGESKPGNRRGEGVRRSDRGCFGLKPTGSAFVPAAGTEDPTWAPPLARSLGRRRRLGWLARPGGGSLRRQRGTLFRPFALWDSRAKDRRRARSRWREYGGSGAKGLRAPY